MAQIRVLNKKKETIEQSKSCVVSDPIASSRSDLTDGCPSEQDIPEEIPEQKAKPQFEENLTDDQVS